MERQLLIEAFKGPTAEVIPGLEEKVSPECYKEWFELPRELIARCAKHDPEARIGSEELHLHMKQMRNARFHKDLMVSGAKGGD